MTYNFVADFYFSGEGEVCHQSQNEKKKKVKSIISLGEKKKLLIGLFLMPFHRQSWFSEQDRHQVQKSTENPWKRAKTAHG